MKITLLRIVLLICVYSSVGQNLSFVKPSNPVKEENAATIATITLHYPADTSINKSDEPRVIENNQLKNQESLLKVVKDNFGNRTEISTTANNSYKKSRPKIDSAAIGYFRGDYGNGAFKYYLTHHHMPLPKDYVVYENFFLLYNEFIFSTSDYVNLEISYVPTNSFGWRSNLDITPRISIPINDFISLGGGISLYVNAPVDPFKIRNKGVNLAGSYFLGITIGDIDHNISITINDPLENNYEWREDLWSTPDTQTSVELSALNKIGPRWSLVTEIFLNKNSRHLLAGFKSHFRKWHLNYGLVVDNGVIPFLSFQFNLRQPKIEPVNRPSIIRDFFH